MIYDLRFNSKIKTIGHLTKVLLENRGVKTKKEVNNFLNPQLAAVTSNSVRINKKELKKAIERIKKAIKDGEEIVIFGDYDVDGICGTAILWETLHAFGAKVFPYIPHRIEEGYGLSERGIKNLKLKIKNCTLIITVDNGIVANSAVSFAKKHKIDVIITDHHIPSKKLPDAYAIVHTTQLCGTGVAYLLAQEIKNQKSKIKNYEDNHLELVALATVADLVPLKDANRSLLTEGLLRLRKTKRIGLLELFKEAGINKEKIGVYEIGHIIAPRLNATGRLDYAMDSLRLLCTTDKKRAKNLAQKIGTTNRERQMVTIETAKHAIEQVRRLADKKELKKLLFVVHESYQQGVIGLVAGKLVEEFYRPAIVVSKGKKYSKASARSIRGFNIIEFIRIASEFLVDCGGHPMAAGFTIETDKIPLLEKLLYKQIGKLLAEKVLAKKLAIDCELPLSFINKELYEEIQKLSPFGMGNPTPTFLSKGVVVGDMRLVGREGKHLKLLLCCYPDSERNEEEKSQILRFTQNDIRTFDAIAFDMGERAGEINIGDKIDVVYSIEQDEWPARQSNAQAIAGGNGEKRLQLKIKDFRRSFKMH